MADDIQILVVAKKEEAPRLFVKVLCAAKFAFHAVELSISVKKQALLDTCEEAAVKVSLSPDIKDARNRSTRILGRRSTKVFDDRFKSLFTKFSKINSLRKSGVTTRRFVVACLNSASCFGASCLGAALS